MTLKIIGKAVIIWFLILVMAIVNGTLREAFLMPMLDEVFSFIVSGALLSVVIFIITYITLPWFGAFTSPQYLVIGLGWLCLTLLFEFTFGRYILDKSWAQLFEAYTFNNGNIWPIVLVATTISPYIVSKIKIGSQIRNS